MINPGVTFMDPLASITTDWLSCECDGHGNCLRPGSGGLLGLPTVGLQLWWALLP